MNVLGDPALTILLEMHLHQGQNAAYNPVVIHQLNFQIYNIVFIYFDCKDLLETKLKTIINL